MKKFFIAIAIILIGIIVISKSQKGDLSDITSDNIEVLATNESIYDYTQPATIVCRLDEGSEWYTNSLRRDCVFCAVPSSCTEVECGGYLYHIVFPPSNLINKTFFFICHLQSL